MVANLADTVVGNGGDAGGGSDFQVVALEVSDICSGDRTQVVGGAAVDIQHHDIGKMVGRIMIQPEQEGVAGEHRTLRDRMEVIIKGVALPMKE